MPAHDFLTTRPSVIKLQTHKVTLLGYETTLKPSCQPRGCYRKEATRLSRTDR